jgi:phosphatidylglycerophosphate synthase
MANLITLLRFPLLFIYILFLYYGNTTIKLWSVPFIIFIIFMDTLDGVIARAKGQTSLLGSVLDIATDRTLELLLWVVFADLGLISILVPLIVIARGTTVDAVRAVGMRHGKSAFEQLKSPVSNFLVSSRMMRSTYGVVKTISFSLLTLVLALESMQSALTSQVHILAATFTWISVVVCLLRGIPVLIEGYAIFKTTTE